MYVLVDFSLQTNVDSRLGSIRCPAVQNHTPVLVDVTHPVSVVSENIQHSINIEKLYVCFLPAIVKYSRRDNV